MSLLFLSYASYSLFIVIIEPYLLLNVFMKIKLIFALIVSTLLFSCSSTPSITIEGNKIIEKGNKYKKITIKPTRIIQKGLGLSFDTTVEDIQNLNFISRETIENGRRKNVGQWFKFMENNSDFWDSKVITFSSKSKTVQSFRARKIYSGSEPVDKECRGDLYLLSDTLKEKYPKLVDVTRIEGIHLFANTIDGYKDIILAEGREENSYYYGTPTTTIMPLGRRISLECWPIGKEGMEKNAYVLNLTYSEEFVFKKESDVDKKARQKRELIERKINTEEL